MNRPTESITSWQRMAKALRHESPDRCPCDLGSTPNTSITRVAYENLVEHLGLSLRTEPAILSKSMQVVEMDEALLERLHIDTRSIFANPPDEDRSSQISEDEYTDEWGIRFKAARIDGRIFYYDAVGSPLAGATSPKEVERHNWPDPSDPGRTRGLREKARHLKESTGYALIGHMGDTSIFQTCLDLRGMERFFLDLLLNKAMAKALLEKVLEIQAIKMEKYLDAVGGYLDVVCVGDDLAGQSGPLISLELYREMVKPYHRAYFALIKKKTSAKVHLHSCGSVSHFLDDLIEMGVDIINPVQISAKGMDPEMLEETYGRKICFWGGIDTQHLLPKGTPEEVACEVHRMIDILGRDGGYVVGAVHNIQPDVPPENIVALYDAVEGLR